MITKVDRNAVRKKRHARIRKKIVGTTERPRLSVFRSNKHIYAQIIDDTKSATIVSASTLDKEFGLDSTNNIDAAKKVGELVAKRALEKGIKQVVFDRGGYLYHGRVKALADAAREAGLEF
ncbi:50S ribosomal protein L18 [Geobacillus subterraneus]|uniref:Large ribosomal subunit protein uL18 n=2 Tax=Geobacillus TaxID=129337 RepID=A0ABN4NQX4_9BACL|nr:MULTISPECIES: 50S ribosomal protein L18 [Geobacillus]AMX84829.1 50S ribosomal protein L18 [Geobacillus subterraneus]KZS25973.1 50S ribosomal protein L18 [Geobacillus subterraneus]OXB85654.1 50S ribosomal protein L18 [Geobacillus uzenensis]QIZ66343.1 50S ribosomal protein L18 [Geobacillus subterraneus]WPZ18547.1 50S ribosomal protein L18 [Geobacillus subterraneus]